MKVNEPDKNRDGSNKGILKGQGRTWDGSKQEMLKGQRRTNDESNMGRFKN